MRSILRTVVPFGVALFIAYYFLFVSTKQDSETGVLVVTSNVAGLQISIDDGATQNVTNAVIGGIKVGVRRITLIAPEWVIEPTYASVDLKANDTARVAFQVVRKTQDSSAVTHDLPRRVETEDYRVAPSVSQRTERKPTASSITSSTRNYRIEVTSNLNNVAIFLNGEPTQAVTPATIDVKTADTYRITLKKEGYHSIPEAAMVRVDPDVGLAATHFEMVSNAKSVETQKLIVDSDPAGAYVLVNGNRYGPTPLTIDLAPGKYRVEFQPITSYESPSASEVTIRKSQSSSVRGEYRKLRGEAYLAIVVPRGADLLDVGKLRIEVDGRSFFTGSSIESGSLLWSNFPEGEHSLLLFYDNLSTETVGVFSSHQVTVLELRFERMVTQIRPKIRVLETTPYPDYRQRSGKITIFN